MSCYTTNTNNDNINNNNNDNTNSINSNNDNNNDNNGPQRFHRVASCFSPAKRLGSPSQRIILYVHVHYAAGRIVSNI